MNRYRSTKESTSIFMLPTLIALLFLPATALSIPKIIVTSDNLTSFTALRAGVKFNTTCYRNPAGTLEIGFTRSSTLSTDTVIKVTDPKSYLKKLRLRIAKARSSRRASRLTVSLRDISKGWKQCKRLLRTHTLGINLESFGYNTVIPFKDLFKISPDWIAKDVGADDPSGKSVPMGSDGYPSVDVPHNTGSGADQILITTLFWNQPGVFPDGDYTLIFEGEGILRLFGATGFREFTEGGTYPITVDNTSTDGINFELRASDVDNNPIQNIQFITPGNSSSLETQPFYPRFLQNLAGFNVIRFMQTTGTNGGEYPCNDDVAATSGECTKSWDTRRLMTDRSQASTQGLAWEYAIDICNAVSAGCWLNIPHGADDEYVSALARLVKQRLRKDLKVYVELSNEIFNTEQEGSEYKYPQSQWASARGIALGLSNDAEEARIKFAAKRTAEILQLFENEFTGKQRKRLVKLLPSWILPGYTEALLTAFHSTEINPNGVSADFLAVGAYIGYSVLEEFFQAGESNSVTVDEILARLKTEIDTDRADPINPGEVVQSLRSLLEELKVLLAQYNLGFISYEGGQHLATISESEVLGEKGAEAQLDVEMGTVYDQLLAEWTTQGGELFMQYSMTVTPDSAASFGALTYTDQDPNTPKLNALRKTLRSGGYIP